MGILRPHIISTQLEIPSLKSFIGLTTFILILQRKQTIMSIKFKFNK